MHDTLRLRGPRVEHGAGFPENIVDSRWARLGFLNTTYEAGVVGAAFHSMVLLDRDGEAMEGTRWFV